VGVARQMLDDSRYGPSSGNRDRQLVDARPHRGAGAALAAGLLLAFNGPGSGDSGISLPRIGAVPAPGFFGCPAVWR